MVGASMIITELAVRDWERLRNVRLAALQDAPGAFVTPLGIERGRPPSHWTTSFDRVRWVVALAGGKDVGLAGLALPDAGSPPYCRYLESVWVNPAYRKQGALGKLLRHIEDKICGDEVTELRLWVLDTNRSVERAYHRHGYRLVPHSTQLTPKRRSSQESATSPFVTERMLTKQLADRSRANPPT